MLRFPKNRCIAYLLVCLSSIAFLKNTELNAQCLNSCSPVLYALDFPCEDILTVDDLGLDVSDCAQPIDISITDMDNNDYGNTITVDMIGLDLLYTVQDANGDNCSNTLTVVDEQHPLFQCPADLDFLCTIDLETIPELVDEDVSDCSDFTITFIDQIDSDFDCTSDTTAVILRNYLVEDEFGNLNDECTQQITLFRPSLSTVAFPDDAIESCVNPNTLPENTGVPTINGEEVMNNPGFCDIIVSYADQNVETCNGSSKIFRTWSVEDECGNISSDEQIIDIIDNIAPEVTAPDDITVDASDPDCTLDVVLEPAIITDDCSTDIDITTQGVFGTLQSNGGIAPNLEIGEYVISYIAVDACGNTGSDQMSVSVQDLSPPQVQCVQDMVVAISNLGFGDLEAENLDAGSYDTCSDIYFKAKRMSVPEGYSCTSDDNPDYMFDDEVRFCCEDIENNNIMVRLRVYDVDPGEGPISDDAFPGRFTECMVEVEVQDQIRPTIVCPPDLIIDCHDDYSDLSVFGMPTAEDNCSLNPIEETANIDIDQCGTGTITRTFTVSDMGGLNTSCIQIITVANQFPFDGNDPNQLSFPDDVIFESCDAGTDVEVTGSPEVNDDQCALIGISHEDELLTIVPDACFMVLRTWKVIDWCQYEHNIPNPQTSENGYWEHTQRIKVIDVEDPIIAELNDTTILNFTADCSMANVVLGPFETEDCTPQELMNYQIEIDLNSDGSIEHFIASNSIDRLLPNGIHRVSFLAEDHCGNLAVDSFDLTVVDGKAPNAVVLNGLAADLMNMGNGVGMIEVSAIMFEASSTDNCTSNENLLFSFSGDTSDSERVFDCDDLGENPVDIWVTDEAGNQSIASTYIIIQDNNEICDESATTTAYATGLVLDEMDNVMEDAVVHATNPDIDMEADVNDDGQYMLEGMLEGGDYDVYPEFDGDILNGVSTLDLVLIQKHLLGLEQLDSPYKIISADINRSKTLSAADLVELRKVILGLQDEFSNNTSWRFIQDDYEFINPLNPLVESFPDVYQIEDMQGNMNIDFIGMKVGDVNNSAIPTTGFTSSVVRDIELFDVKYESVSENVGEIIIKSSSNIDLIGLQMGINYNNESLEVLEVISNTLENFNDHNYRIDQRDTDNVLVSWSNPYAQNLEAEQELLRLKVIKKNTDKLIDIFTISTDLLQSEYYDPKNGSHSIDFNYSLDIEVGQDLVLYQNTPNPGSSLTHIPFYLGKDGEVALRITDSHGKVVYALDSYPASAGMNKIEVNLASFDSGIYQYTVKSSSNFRTKRMIIVR